MAASSGDSSNSIFGGLSNIVTLPALSDGDVSSVPPANTTAVVIPPPSGAPTAGVTPPPSGAPTAGVTPPSGAPTAGVTPPAGAAVDGVTPTAGAAVDGVTPTAGAAVDGVTGAATTDSLPTNTVSVDVVPTPADLPPPAVLNSGGPASRVNKRPAKTSTPVNPRVYHTRSKKDMAPLLVLTPPRRRAVRPPEEVQPAVEVGVDLSFHKKLDVLLELAWKEKGQVPPPAPAPLGLEAKVDLLIALAREKEKGQVPPPAPAPLGLEAKVDLLIALAREKEKESVLIQFKDPSKKDAAFRQLYEKGILFSKGAVEGNGYGEMNVYGGKSVCAEALKVLREFTACKYNQNQFDDGGGGGGGGAVAGA